MQINKDSPELFLKLNKQKSGLSLSLSIICGATSGFLLVAHACLLARIIDGLFFKHQSFENIKTLAFLLAAVYILRFILGSASDMLAYKGAQEIKYALRTELFTRIRKLGGIYVNSKGSGLLLNSLSDGIEGLEKYYSQFIPAKAFVMCIPLAILAAAAPFDLYTFFVFFFTAPLVPLFMILIGKGAEKLNQEQWQKLARMGNHLMDVVQGATTIKIFSAERKIGEEVSRIADEFRSDTMRVLRIAFLSAMALEFFATVSIAVTAVMVGFNLMWGKIEFLNGLTVLLLAPEFYIPFRRLGAAYHARMEAIGAAEKISEIFKEALPDNRNIISNPDISTVDIDFSNVEFAYNGNRKALNNISLSVNRGQKVALIGKSGSGKSTVFNLLLKFISVDIGSIKINGIDIKDIDTDYWRNNIAWVPQSPTLFSGSVMDNLRLGNNLSESDIIKRCKSMHIDDFISSLPNGYETKVGDSGYGLSGGEIQRIAIARALMRDAGLLLLDEPTASLDKETEKLMQKAISDYSIDKTVIIIAHRLHTIKNADKIILLNEGKISSGEVGKFIEENEEIIR